MNSFIYLFIYRIKYYKKFKREIKLELKKFSRTRHFRIYITLDEDFYIYILNYYNLKILGTIYIQ